MHMLGVRKAEFGWIDAKRVREERPNSSMHIRETCRDLLLAPFDAIEKLLGSILVL
jgi:hypothetical protein